MIKKKIVWTINSIFPEAANESGKQIGEKGHWLYTLFDSIKEEMKGKCSFHIVHFTSGVDKLKVVPKNLVTYYLLPVRKYAYLDKYKKEQKILRNLIIDINPDLVHIHGTEDVYGLVAKHINCPVIVSLQGIRNEIIKYYFSDISRLKYFMMIFKYRDLNLVKNLISWRVKTKQETEIVKLNKYFIGRTLFDQACLKALNPKANYLMGDDHRIVRKEFYENEWEIRNTKKFVLHVTLSESTFKGIFLLVKAIETVKNFYPEIKVNIAGTFKGSIGSETHNAIRKKKLTENFHFLGRCNSSELIDSMLHSRLFVHPSYIDNSPNSVQEAQILGMPVIASYTGGIPSLIEDNRTGLLFPRGDSNYLSILIIKLIEDEKLAMKLGMKAKEYRESRNNPAHLSSRYITLYNNFLLTD